MLLFITTEAHGYTVSGLVHRRIGTDTPRCASISYDVLFRSSQTVSAVHIFTDLERLANWQLARAADLYRSLRESGIVCLNDPARVMTRYQLLVNLKSAGINPFTAYHADGLPKPARFPVFVRGEGDHKPPLSDMLRDQSELDGCLEQLWRSGRPLRGLIVVEFAAEPIAPGVWRKFGTFRIGPGFSVHHMVLSSHWAVKEEDSAVVTEGRRQEENDFVVSNTVAELIRPAFDIAGIEWGRADHATYGGRQIVYEINTNPNVQFDTSQSSIRGDTKRFSRDRFARLLWEIDAGDGSSVRFRPLGGPWPQP